MNHTKVTSTVNQQGETASYERLHWWRKWITTHVSWVATPCSFLHASSSKRLRFLRSSQWETPHSKPNKYEYGNVQVTLLRGSGYRLSSTERNVSSFGWHAVSQETTGSLQKRCTSFLWHLKILGASRVTWSWFHTEKTWMLGTTVRSSVTTAILRPGFVHPSFTT